MRGGSGVHGRELEWVDAGRGDDVLHTAYVVGGVVVVEERACAVELAGASKQGALHGGDTRRYMRVLPITYRRAVITI